MALSFDAKETTKALVDAVTGKIQTIFPVEGRQHTLHVSDVQVDDDWDMKDIHGQMAAKLHGRTWGVPIVGTLTLKDKATGKVLDKKTNARIMTLPVMTRHYSYIVDGKEYDVTRQFRLKAGVYHRVKANGQIEAQWNLSKGRGFHTAFDPSTRKFTMQYGSSTVGLYSVLRILGASDEELRRVWGKDVYEVNRTDVRKDLHKLSKVITGEQTADDKTAVDAIRANFDQTAMRADVNQLTLGKPFDRVATPALLRSSEKLLGMSRGTDEPDQRDSAAFKEMLDIDDFLTDRLTALTRRIQGKVRNRLDREETVDAVYSSDYLNHPVKTFFSAMALAETPRQINPVDMFGSMTKTTVMGEGGIQSAHGVPLEARILDNSHAGVLDPLQTPEGGKVGITLHLPLAAAKVGREPASFLRNLKTGKLEQKTVAEMLPLTIAFPDQYMQDDEGKPVPVGKKVAALGPGNEIIQTSPKNVDYVFPTPKALFSVATNLVPFMQNNTGPRVAYATHHMEQALSLKHREKPLIAVSTGSSKGPATFEELVARYFTSRSPVDGKVLRVTKEFMTIRGVDGKLYREPLYDNYPLNEKSAFISSEPLVKAGDQVKAGQTVADTNHTKDGSLALGVNLRVAYVPYLSETFDDAIVISESASQKLTSQHLYKEQLEVDTDTIVSRDKYRAMYRDRMDDRQAKQLEADGVIKEGTIVQPGDTLVAALRKRSPTEEEMLIKGIGKSLVRPFSDISIKWDSQYPGRVERVVKASNRIQVHVSSEEPADVGDKLCYHPDTEVLTKRGWIKVGAIELEDELLTYHSPDNPTHRRSTSSGWLEWQKPTRVVQFEHEGELYRISNPYVEQLVTPNHQLFVKVLAKKQKDVRQNRFRLTKATHVYGKRAAYAVFASNPFGPEPFEVEFGGRKYPTRPFLRVLARLYRYGANVNGVVMLGDPKLWRSILVDLQACAIDHVVTSTGRGSMLAVMEPALAALDLRKELPAMLEDLPSDTIRWFLRMFLLPLRMGNSLSKAAQVCARTVTNEMVDRLQALGVRARMAFDVVRINDELQSITVRMLNGRVSSCSVIVNGSKGVKEDSFEPYAGKVFCCTVPNHVLVTRFNGKVVLSGNSGRHGNKGVVAKVLPDDQMPRTENGPVDIILNPITTAGRIIVGPTLEVALSKVADKEGNQIAVSNFEARPDKRIVRVKEHWRTVKTKEGLKRIRVAEYSYERDYRAEVEEELRKAGISETEEMTDPVTGKSMGKVLTGKQYILKHIHQSEKKLAARSGGPGYDYDANMAPRSAGSGSGQSIGELGLYALLAHGATSLIREGNTLKSDATQDEVWTAIQLGEPLPQPRPSFAYGKFLALLAAIGVSVDKSGSQLQLRPMTDEDILKMSNGELKDPSLTLRAKDLKPEEGGLFDTRITGGVRGDRWCIDGSSMVMTTYGLERIDHLVQNEREEQVWGWDFAANKFVLRNVIGWHAHAVIPDEEPVGKVTATTEDGKAHELTCTYKHQVPTAEGKKDIGGQAELLVVKGGK